MKATLLAIPMSRSGIIVFMKKVEKTSAAEIHPAIKSHIGHLRLLRSSSAGEAILLSDPVAWSSAWNSGNRPAGFDDARTKRKPQPRAAPVLSPRRAGERRSRRLLLNGSGRTLDGERASALDEMQASAAQRSTPASLPQLVETSSGTVATAFHAKH
jgi:hypothetical protein